MINHTDKEVASLNLLQTIPSGAIVVVPITKSVNPSDATPTALNNALVRNADGINALRQDLATITVSGDPACDGGVGCPSIGAYLVTQGVLLNTVIGAIPGNPVAPISTLNPLVIYVIPGNPV